MGVPMRGCTTDVSPQTVLSSQFNGYVQAVILRISEIKDLGEGDRFKFYEHTKSITTNPPEALLVNKKYIDPYYVPNVCGVVYTTNYKTGGLYLPADDRRHYFAWSTRTKEDFAEG